MRYLLPLLSLILFIQCNQIKEPTDFDLSNFESKSVNLVTNFNNSSSVIFGHIHQIEQDNYNNIYVLDWGSQSIYIFSPKGILIKEFVNKGKGPGEYQSLRKIYITDNKLYIVDDTLLKVSEFEIINKNADFKHLKDTIYPDRAFTRIEYFFVIDEDTYAFVFFKRGFSKHDLWNDKFAGLQLFDTKSQTYNEIFETEGREYFRYENSSGWGVRPLAYGSYPLFDFDGSYFYFGINKELKIHKINHEGNITSDAINYVYTPPPVTREEQLIVINDEFYSRRRVKEEIANQLPQYWRILNSFFVDQKSRYWLSVNTNKYKNNELWLNIDYNNNEQQKLIFDSPIDIKLVFENNIYGVVEDSVGIHTLSMFTF